MKLFCTILNLSLLLFVLGACGSTQKLSKKEQLLLQQAADRQRIADSLATVVRADSLFRVVEARRLDSIRVADSLAAIPKVNYDTVLVASLLRTPCYGKCPQYEIRLYASGYATFEGMAHVEHLGQFEARVDPQIIENLIIKAIDINYIGLSDSYPVKGKGIEDFPLCVTGLFTGNRQKIIYNRNDAPKELVSYEEYFDELFEEINWKKIQEKK